MHTFDSPNRCERTRINIQTGCFFLLLACACLQTKKLLVGTVDSHTFISPLAGSGHKEQRLYTARLSSRVQSNAMSPKSNDATPPLPRLLWFACLLTAFATFVHPTAASTSSSVSKRSPALPAERAALAPFVLPPKPSTCDRRPATFRPGRLRLLYDITPQEGFNLRRDVYVRMAVFARHMQKSGAIGWHDVRLVVPPFRQMPHWQNADDNNDELMRPHYWTKFFDLQQIAAYAPVLDAWEYYAEQQRRPTPVHFVQLINYPVDDGPFSDRYELTKRLCKATPPIFGECNITVAEYWNARFQGNVVGLGRLVEELWRRRDASAESADLHVYLWRADIALHMRFGEAEYWRARRSMRFAGYLEREATDYRRTGMGLPVLEGEVQRPWRWQDEMVSCAASAINC